MKQIYNPTFGLANTAGLFGLLPPFLSSKVEALLCVGVTCI